MTLRIVTPALARKCQREYEAGEVSMKAIAKRHGVSPVALRRMRQKLGLPRCEPARSGPASGSNYGGGVRRFEPSADDLRRWNAEQKPGWLVHGEVRA